MGARPDDARLPVLAEGPGWVVVAKPAGLACHRSAMVPDRVTVHREAVRAFDRDIHLVHRLDRATSGCLVLAFDPETTARLQAAMADATARKTYLALVRGFWRWDDPVAIDVPIKDTHKVPREAHTVAEAIGRGHHPAVSLVRAQPSTGRYHQVRRHLRDCAHPVLGDAAHGDVRRNRRWRAAWGLPRLGLHCARLSLPLPGGDRLEATCPFPADLHALTTRMPWWPDAVAAEPLLAEPPLELSWPQGPDGRALSAARRTRRG